MRRSTVHESIDAESFYVPGCRTQMIFLQNLVAIERRMLMGYSALTIVTNNISKLSGWPQY